ncbi:MAG TPA: hypothetical protein VF989_13030 [Polyangiaceae bacterium]
MARRRTTLWLSLLALGGACAGLLDAGPASARVDADSPYTKAQTFSGALRYVRIDLGFSVVEQDARTAYVIFEYQPSGQRDRSSTGTIEVVDTSSGVKVYVRLPKMPEYHERVLRDGLMRKLREEYGVPAPRERPKPSPDAGDAGRD